MLKMSSQIENIVNAYKTLTKVPSILSARVNKAGNKVTSKWSIRNLDKGKTTKFNYDYLLDDKFNVISKSDFGTDVSTELLSAVSPSETLKAIIREEKDAKDVKKQYLEVWQANQLAHSVDLTALDVHGDVYADGEFGCLDWSRDETALVYVAEKKLVKSEPYIKRKPSKDSAKDGSGEPAPKKGEEYIYRQDWGEQLVGKHLSVVVVFRLGDETLTVLQGLPETWCPGKVSFTPDGASVVGVAWETEPRRLGLIFCTNRPSYIFSLTLDGQMTKLSGEGLSVRSPRVSPGQLVWLQRAAGGPHHAAHDLVLYDTNTKQSRVVIPANINMETSNGKPNFLGIYSQQLPSRCFSSDNKRLIFSTPQANEVRSYVLDLESSSLVDISGDQPGSTSILDVNNDVIVAVQSNITTTGQIYIARLPSTNQVSWRRVSDPATLPPSVATAKVEYLELEHQNDDSVRKFTAILTIPETNGKKLPLIVWPHGGPHSNFVNGYALETALFTMLGFASLQINYRGSTGQGQASVDFLPSKAGKSDVEDCKLATDQALKLYPVDKEKVVLFGGSHGGFLVTHLSGQYPDVYKAVVSRNPVIDVASMANSTDIPDWCAVEAGFDFSEAGAASEDHLLIMRRCSPLAHVHKVKAPTALMLGTGDKRVPYYQGLEYYRRLKANGVKARLYMYDDCHSLSSPAVEMDNLINSAAWFFEHLD